MTGFQGSFDATQFQPSQSVGAHPAGIFDAQITGTANKPVKDNPNAGLFEVEFTTPQGRIFNRYNIWNPSPQATEIAHKELSALCHATGVHRLDWQNEGAALRGARLKIEVGKQANTDYMEVKRVMDVNGNEPGRAPASAPQPQQANGGWAQPPQQAPVQQPQQPAWQAGPTVQPQQPVQQAPQGWGQGQTNPQQPTPDNRPPWVK